jgi:hypothetical protein
MKDSYLFKSSAFEIELGEDAEANPRRYGRQLANWLKARFGELGYEVEEVIAEDWGWCVMCQREPFSLWIGCGNREDSNSANAKEDDPPPKGDEVIWECFVAADVPFFKKFFSKIDTSSALEKLDTELKSALASESSIRFVDET